MKQIIYLLFNVKVRFIRELKFVINQLKSVWYIFIEGKPKYILIWGRAVGDNLIFTPAAFKYYRQNGKRVWIITYYPSLFKYNPSVIIFRNTGKEENYFSKRGLNIIYPIYSKKISSDKQESPKEHIIKIIASKIKIELNDAEMAPKFFLKQNEKIIFNSTKPIIAIQSGSLNASFPMLNKQWFNERFQQVVDSLSYRYNFIQIGNKDDFPLQGTMIDFRGKTSVRKVIAIIASVDMFVGLVGFFMHAAKAVNTRAIIIYGGRENPSQSGYSSNINIHNSLDCSPCWQWNHCEYNRACMENISVNSIVKAITENQSI